MNETRQLVENYKKRLHCNFVARSLIEKKMTLPANYSNLDYWPMQKEWSKAFDRACAAELGVTLDEAELDDFYRDRSEEDAEAWAKTMPKMPKPGYSIYRSVI